MHSADALVHRVSALEVVRLWWGLLQRRDADGTGAELERLAAVEEEARLGCDRYTAREMAQSASRTAQRRTKSRVEEAESVELVEQGYSSFAKDVAARQLAAGHTRTIESEVEGEAQRSHREKNTSTAHVPKSSAVQTAAWTSATTGEAQESG